MTTPIETTSKRQPVEQLSASGRPTHNHFTRDIKQLGGICPACDLYMGRFDEHWSMETNPTA